MKKALLTLGLVALLGGNAAAADLYWDGDGVGPQGGGPGVWNTTSVHFATTAGGAVDQIWNNANGDNAIFTATASTAITLAGPITVGTLTTTIGGNTIGNGNGVTTAANSLSFVGNSGTINTLQTSGSTQLTAHLSGQTVTKAGPGRLELNNSANAGTNRYIINEGAVTAPAPSRYGAPAALVQDFFTFNGGGLGANTTANYDLGANRGVTLKAGGAYFGTTNLAPIITISAPIVGTEGGDISVVGNAAPFVGSSHVGGAVLVLSNTNNSFDGDLFVSGPTGSAIRAGASNVVPDTAVVNTTAAGNTFDLATNNASDTVKALSGNAGSVSLGAASVLTLSSPAGQSYGGVISGTTGSVAVQGSGSQALTGANTYGGGTIINGGTVYANNTTGSATGTGQVTVNTGGTLAGTGGLTGQVNINAGGTLAPGASVESLNTGAVAIASGGTLAYELDSSAVLASAADLVNASGGLTLAPGALLSVVDLAATSTALDLGTKFTVVRYTGSWDGGTFAGLSNLATITVGANTFEIRYDDTVAGANFGGGTAGGTYLTLTAVPEASAFLFGGLGCCAAGLAAWRRRRA